MDYSQFWIAFAVFLPLLLVYGGTVAWMTRSVCRRAEEDRRRKEAIASGVTAAPARDYSIDTRMRALWDGDSPWLGTYNPPRAETDCTMRVVGVFSQADAIAAAECLTNGYSVHITPGEWHAVKAPCPDDECVIDDFCISTACNPPAVSSADTNASENERSGW